MKTMPLFITAVSFVLAGCGEKSDSTPQATNKPAATSSGSLITAPVDYLGAVAKAQQTAVKSIDTSYLNQAIQLFNAQEGRYPKDLNELVTQKYIGQIPAAPVNMKIVYDANAGKVSVVRQ